MSRNARINFATAISTYVSDLDEQLKEGIKQDEIYQNLQSKVKENPTENLIKGYILNEKEFLQYKDRMYVPNVTKIKLLIHHI